MWLLVNNIRIKFSDKQLTICLYFALWCYHAPPTGIWLVQTFVQLFVLCCVFLFLALSLKLWIKMLLLSANLSAILFFCYCFSRYLSIIFYFNFLHWFRLSVLKKFQVFALFGMNWHALCQSECRIFFYVPYIITLMMLGKVTNAWPYSLVLILNSLGYRWIIGMACTSTIPRNRRDKAHCWIGDSYTHPVLKGRLTWTFAWKFSDLVSKCLVDPRLSRSTSTSPS